MISRENIRHAAILKPHIIKRCNYYLRTGTHADALNADVGRHQCIECGQFKPLKPREENYGIHKLQTNQ